MENFEPNDEQIFATYIGENWYHRMEKQTLEISGPAGSGKTSLVRYLIERLKLDIDDVLFCAFSGKAVSQLAKHGLPAKTIHSAIYEYVKEPKEMKMEELSIRKMVKPKWFHLSFLEIIFHLI